MRRIMMPPGPASEAPKARPQAIKSIAKPVARPAAPKSKSEKDIAAAKLSLAAKLAEAKSKIIKKSK
jgi:hypothetical protein